MIPLPRSLRHRLLLLVLGTMLVVWLAMAALTWFDARHQLEELLDGHLAQAAALLVAQQSREMGEGEDHDLDTPTLHRYSPLVAFQVFHEGRLVLRTANAPERPMVEPAEGFREGFRTVGLGKVDWRVFAAYGAERDVQVYVGEQAASRAAILLAVLRSALGPMVLALPLLALAASWAVYCGVAPLRRLGASLAARQPQSLQPLAVEAMPTEVQPVLDALNSLFARIATLLESERRFTADAAHELRTPIAAIRAHAQVALGEADAGQRRRALLHTLAGCDRATRLVEQLLTLARVEAGASTALHTVDLAPLARSVIGELAPRAIERHQVVALHAPAACPVRGDETLLGVLLRNLVDNALRYSTAGAHVTVALARQGDRVVLDVQDSGPGLTAAEQACLGERFFRIAGSGASGSGLGWSIVRRIAAVHAASVGLSRSAALGGLAVRVELAAAVG